MTENSKDTIEREICEALGKCDENINQQILDSIEKGRYDIIRSFTFGVSKHFENLEYGVHAKFFEEVAKRYFSHLGYKASCTFNDFLGTVNLTISWKEAKA